MNVSQQSEISAVHEEPKALKFDRVRVNTLALEGELNIEAIADIDELLASLSRAGSVNLVLDFSDVTHLDYRGVACLAERARFVRQLGGDVRLCSLSPYLYAILRVAGVHNAFQYFEQAPQAMASFQPLVKASPVT